MSNLIEVINLEKAFINNSITKRVLKDISFSLIPGEICGIIGESGCGKSTLAKLLCGIHTATSGNIVFENEPLLHIRKRDFNKCADIQYIFQDPYSSLESRYTVSKTILETIKLCKRHKREYIEPDKAFDLVHMNFYDIKEKKISELSGGQRQRVSIARALIPQPKLIIADECTSMLDKETSKFIYDIFKNLNTNMNMTFILITHHKEAIVELCSKILVIHKGTIVDCGTWKELNHEPQSNYTEEYIDSMRFVEAF